MFKGYTNAKSVLDVLLSKKLFVFDIDGTVSLDATPFPYALDFIHNLRKSGRKVLFFTNNSSCSTEFYYGKLEKMGFAPQDGEILTSGDVTIDFLLRERKGKSVYLVGTPDLENCFEKHGITLSENSDIVVSSFDKTLTDEKVEKAAALIKNGAEFLATHYDMLCPVTDGVIPDCGTISEMISEKADGAKATVFGKPYLTAVEKVCSQTGIYNKDDIIIFGDALKTDIAMGRLHGMKTGLVMTGVTSLDDLEMLTDELYPDFTFHSLEEVNNTMFCEAIV